MKLDGQLDAEAFGQALEAVEIVPRLIDLGLPAPRRVVAPEAKPDLPDASLAATTKKPGCGIVGPGGIDGRHRGAQAGHGKELYGIDDLLRPVWGNGMAIANKEIGTLESQTGRDPGRLLERQALQGLGEIGNIHGSDPKEESVVHERERQSSLRRPNASRAHTA